MTRAFVLAVPLLLPLFAVSALSRSYADDLGDDISAQLGCAALPLASLALDAVSGSLQDAGAIFSLTSAPSAGANVAHSARHSARVNRLPAAHAVAISAAQVLALAARRAIPQAVPVQATANHPAGLLLRGVSAMGVGLLDGDVLTEAAGQKASSVGAVIGIVLAARARQAPEISGRFYRAGVPFRVTVEQPYPKAVVPG